MARRFGASGKLAGFNVAKKLEGSDSSNTSVNPADFFVSLLPSASDSAAIGSCCVLDFVAAGVTSGVDASGASVVSDANACVVLEFGAGVGSVAGESLVNNLSVVSEGKDSDPDDSLMPVGEGVGSACEVSEFELSVVSEDSESDPDDSVMPVSAGVGSVWLVSESELSVDSENSDPEDSEMSSQIPTTL
ncbi:unnamed protein product [Phytophthora lilii]|uniref:Unnamed protein product n=1 Tax=Phytophthora lilii TaxID=2077276 RepID=A0A9W6X726_9STRA|nr:unnamed protein product [Phytophthora lilii]